MRNLHFLVTKRKGALPVEIVADTIEDAHCQAREWCDGLKPYKMEQQQQFVPNPYGIEMLSRLNKSMADVFAY